MALVSPPINGGTLASLTGSEDFASISLSNNMFLCVSAQDTPFTAFYYLAERNTTTGAFTYHPAKASTALPGTTAGVVMVRVAVDKVALLYSGGGASINHNLVTFDLNTKRVTAISNTVSQSTSNETGSGGTQGHVMDRRISMVTVDSTNPYMSVVSSRHNSSLTNSMCWTVRWVTPATTASISYFGGPGVATTHGMFYRLFDGSWAGSGDYDYYGYFSIVNSVWNNNATLNGTASYSPSSKFNNESGYEGRWFTYAKSGVVFGTNSAATSVSYWSTADGYRKLLTPSGAPASFVSTAVNPGAFHAKFIDDNTVVIGYFDFNAAHTSLPAKTATIAPTKLHLRWFTRTNATTWAVTPRSAAAGGYTVDIPYNAVWGSIKNAGQGIVWNDDYTYTLNYENQTVSGNRLFDSYTQTLGDSPKVTFSTAATISSVRNGTLFNTIRATSTNGGTYSYQIVGGRLPSGAVMDNSNGTITGTNNSTLNSRFTVQATDSMGATNKRTFSLASDLSRWTTMSDDGSVGTAPYNGGNIRTSITASSTTTFAFGAPYANNGGVNAQGAVFVMENGNLQAKLFSPSPVANGNFGTSVALSADGNTLVVGVMGSPSTERHAHVYTRSGSTWTYRQKLQPNDLGSQDTFGFAVGISGNGQYIVVGSFQDSGTNNFGKAYVYLRSGNTFTQQQKIASPVPNNQARFGYQVAINSDGTTLAVSAPYDYTAAPINGYGGNVFVFTRSGTSWSNQATLIGISNSDSMGVDSLAMSGDGSTIVVGTSKSYAHLYKRTGTTWTNILPAFTRLGTTIENTSFGNHVAISSDGSTLVVGAEGGNGTAYRFALVNNQLVLQQQYIGAPSVAGGQYGRGVTISGDGNIVYVTNPGYLNTGGGNIRRGIDMFK